MIFFLENPKVGTTDEQDAAYKTIKSLVCNEMTDKAVYRYMNDYFHLASKSGRMWANEELSTEFFTKLPRFLGDKIEKAFKERHPTNTIGVSARIAFTRNYLHIYHNIQIIPDLILQGNIPREVLKRY